MNTSLFKVVLPMALLGLGAFSIAGNRNPLVQPRIFDFVERAENAAFMGQYEEAAACAEAVMMKPVLRVAVDNSGLDFVTKLKAQNALEKATQEWTRVLNGDVQFEIVSGRSADIRVTYNSDVRHIGREVAGVATWSRQVINLNGNFVSRVKADIELRTIHPNGTAMSEDSMTQSSMHELGHVLGLWDSAVVGDVMGPLKMEAPATKLSNRELNAISEVRQTAYAIWESCVSAMNMNRSRR